MKWPFRREPEPSKDLERKLRAAFAAADQAADEADAAADAARREQEDEAT